MPLQLRSSRSKDKAQRLEFQYRPLRASDEIRVLEVSPFDVSKEKFGEQPVLSIIHITLGSPITYAAVSYTWGQPQDLEDLVVDGSVLPVRPNLKRMISNLSDRDHKRNLWIDAVCINQANNEEKSAQVKNMGDIYSKANFVIAYVKGTDHDSYRRAYYSKGKSHKYLSLYSTMESIRRAVTTNNVNDLIPKLDYTRLFDNNFFTRRWIIQEVCLARSVIICCDGSEMGIGCLERYFDIFSAKHGYGNSRAAKLIQMRRRLSAGTSKLEDLLYNHEEAICNERHDRVYALISLSTSGKRYIPVDYKINPIHLLLSTVQTAALYEELHISRTISFACFLRQNLEITMSEFEEGMLDTFPLGRRTNRRQLFVQVCVRSLLQSTRLEADVEDALNQRRAYLPSLRHYAPVRLYSTAMEIRSDDSEIYVPGHDSVIEGENIIDGFMTEAINLFAFSSTTPNQEILAGMSSAHVQTNDEVWQFPRTPVAVIARPNSTGYSLVARAMILKRDFWNPSSNIEAPTQNANGDVKIESILDCVIDPASEGIATTAKTIALSPSDLLGLMRWVDFIGDLT